MLNRRAFLLQTMATATIAPTTAAIARRPMPEPAWYRSAIIIDGLSSFSDPYAPPEQARVSDRLVAELRSTGSTAINITVGSVGNGPKGWEDMVATVKAFDDAINANSTFLVRIENAADILAAKANGRFGLIYGTQDTSMIGSSLERLAEMRKIGIRIVQLTYNLRNLSGDGALEPANAGLSKLGLATIAEIERQKLLLDLSHGGARTIAEAIAAATRPLSINHSGCRDLVDHLRNTYDSAMKALADKGGVFGLYFMPYLAPSFKPTRETLIRHIEHAANICGEDHISIGTDGDQLPIVINEDTWKRAREMHEYRLANGIAAPGEGPDVLTIVMDYNRLDRFQQLAMDLSKRGWTQSRLEKLFGANLLRLYADVWGG